MEHYTKQEFEQLHNEDHSGNSTFVRRLYVTLKWLFSLYKEANPQDVGSNAMTIHRIEYLEDLEELIHSPAPHARDGLRKLVCGDNTGFVMAYWDHELHEWRVPVTHLNSGPSYKLEFEPDVYSNICDMFWITQLGVK